MKLGLSAMTDHSNDRSTRSIYTYLTGQYDNLGDALLRRAMLSELKATGNWHIFLGSAPADYRESLDLPGNAQVYSSRRTWLMKAVASLVRPERAAYISNPGEISSSRHEFFAGMMSLILILAARVGRNPSFRIGLGARDRKRPWSLPHELCARLATKSYWRDEQSASMYGSGEVAPDWAFALPSHPTQSPKSLLTLSYRGDKPTPAVERLREVKEWAENRGLITVIVSQVRSDIEANDRLAEELGVTHHGKDARDLSDFEKVARSLYSNSAVVLSNRIHVLITAAVDGAVPAAVIAHQDVKVKRTMAGGTLEANMLRTDEIGAPPIGIFLDDVIEHGTSSVERAVERAQSHISTVVRDVLERTAPA